MTPAARKTQLLTQSVGNELVIYDERTDQAHHLNATAAIVWRSADGVRSLPELASELRRSLPSLDDASVASVEIEDSEELVRLALELLDRSGLLVRALPAVGEPMTRRRMIAVSATLLPAVASIVAPTPAMAQFTPFFTVSVTARYRHLGPGQSIVCVDTVTSPPQPNVDFTLTLTGPSTSVTRNDVSLENGVDQEIFNISSFGTYTTTASVTVLGRTATGTATVNVTQAQGTCPEGYEDT